MDRELVDGIKFYKSEIDFEIEQKIVNHKICDFSTRPPLLPKYAQVGQTWRYLQPYGPMPWRISTKTMRYLRDKHGRFRADRALASVNSCYSYLKDVTDFRKNQLSSYILSQIEEYQKLGSDKYRHKLFREGRL